MANTYRCYFTDKSDRIQTYEQIECLDDAAAVLKVEELLAASKYSTGELWHGKRLVGRWGTAAGDADVEEQVQSEQSA